MSLMKTLAKVAIGVAVAKGVSTLARSSQSGRIGTGGAAERGTGGGLEGMMGAILGGTRGSTPSARGGSIGDLLNELGGAGQAGRPATRAGQPDIGAILGQLTGRSAGGAGGAGGGLGGFLGQLTSAGAAGGLGGLLGGILSGSGGGQHAGVQTGGQQGGLGGVLDQALRNGGEPDTSPAPEQELAAAVLLKAMIQAAKADGQIDAGEQAKLLDRLGDVTDAERTFVQAELQAPVDPEGLAKLVPGGLEAQAYLMSVMAIDLDNQAEAQYLDRLARALGLTSIEVNRIHDRLGVPQLYA